MQVLMAQPTAETLSPVQLLSQCFTRFNLQTSLPMQPTKSNAFAKKFSPGTMPPLAGVRGKGLLLGFALNPDAIPSEQDTPPALHLCKSLMKNGLLSVPAGTETLRWLPPLNVSDSEIDEALNILKNTLDSF